MQFKIGNKIDKAMYEFTLLNSIKPKNLCDEYPFNKITADNIKILEKQFEIWISERVERERKYSFDKHTSKNPPSSNKGSGKRRKKYKGGHESACPIIIYC